MRYLWIFIALLAGLCHPAYAQSCAARPLCSQMTSCAEADFYFRQCGHSERDGDSDGIPCEALCGDTMALYVLRRGAGGAAAQSAPAAVSCGSKRTCKQMVSCAEAKAYLNQCGVTSLDRDGDGVPCESLCR